MIHPVPREQSPLLEAVDRDLDARLSAVDTAIQRSHAFFLRAQHRDGYWVAPLEADTTLESDYIFLLRLLGTNDKSAIQKAAREIRSRQLRDGGWNIYDEGPEEINATVKAYTALKLSGAVADDPALVRARAAIVRMGGIARTNSYTRTYLNLIGQFPLHGTPAIPPELILLPTWFYFNIYEISSWSRAILVPLSIIYALRPTRKIPDGMGIRELFDGGPRYQDLHFPRSRPALSWGNLFLLINRLLKLWEKTPVKPFRSLALRKAERWILDRMEDSAGLGAIYPAMLNSIIALKALGYPMDHFQMRRALDQLKKLIMDRGDSLRFQPCESPVWDTGLAMMALLNSGMSPSHPALIGAADWLLDREVTKRGDWSVKNPWTPPGGWYFEFANEFYPDLDDTCVVLAVLRMIEYPHRERSRAAQARGLRWLLEMQSSNGGWASFDRDNDRKIFTKIPFADHNAMIDPPTGDITGRILEMLSYFGYTRRSACVERAVRFLRREQEPDGSWIGRWGVNYIYGTWQVLKGLYAIGEDMSQEYVQRAAQWLRTKQRSDGGWGETCLSYHDPTQRGEGPSTPSQTAWAVMGLLSAGDSSSEAVLAGVDYLLERQNEGGDWNEEAFTGTGFPRVFYLRYRYYGNYFPLFALGMYRKLAGPSSERKPA